MNGKHMTYNGGEYSVQELFTLLQEIVETQGIRSYEEYIDAVDGLLEEKKSYGFFSEDEDLMQMRNVLENRWQEIRR